MDMIHDGVEIYCIPYSAHCIVDEMKRSPLDMEECPIGCEVCTGECMYYTEN